jgi:hypothetical protein
MSEREAVATLPLLSLRRSLGRMEVWWVVAFFSCYFLAWTLLPLLTGSEVPGDNIEQLRWATEPAWGYDKHPPWPTIVLWLLEHVLPTGAPLTYFLGAVQAALLGIGAALVARDTLPWPAKWLAPLLITCISYYTFRMHYYNHNTALMVAYAGALYCCSRIRSTWQMRWWVALGICWGLGILSKYQMAVPIACNLAFFWTVREGRLRSIVAGVLVTSLVASVILAPHAVWLINNGFPSFEYAATRLGAELSLLERIDDIFRFLTHQMLRLAPILVFLGLLKWGSRTNRPAGPDVNLPTADPEVRRFYAIHFWGPFVAMVMLCAMLSTDLQSHWGTAFLWVLPLYLLATPFGARLTASPLPLVLRSMALVQVLSAVSFASGKFGGGFGG